MGASILKLTLVVLVLAPIYSINVLHAAETKPNFVIISADDLGYGDVGYQGGDVPTPNIDSIAEKGVPTMPSIGPGEPTKLSASGTLKL